MLDLSKFIADILYCIGIPYVSPGYTGTREDLWKIEYDKYGNPIRVPTVSGMDCSGLLVRAYALQLEKLTHGSNYIWRYDLDEKGKLTTASQLEVGMAVFKWANDGGEPDKYKKDGLGNFHHIGVVTSKSPLTITHASSAKGKVVQDTSIKGWTHWGKLSKVEYKEVPIVIEQKRVYAENGLPVRLRAKPSETAAVLTKVDSGTSVTASDSGVSGWSTVTTGPYSGYMMSKFLRDEGEKPKTLEERVAALEAVVFGGK